MEASDMTSRDARRLTGSVRKAVDILQVILYLLTLNTGIVMYNQLLGGDNAVASITADGSRYDPVYVRVVK